MARLGVSNGQPVSLFPMFSKLVCTLGCLMLTLGTVTAISLGIGKTVSINVRSSSEGQRQHKTPTYIEWDGKKDKKKCVRRTPEQGLRPLLTATLGNFLKVEEK